MDIYSTCSAFCDNNLLHNIRNSPNTLRAITNGGQQDSHLIGDLPGFFPEWFNKNSMLNILSFAQVRKVYRITIDTDITATTNVHLHNGSIMTLRK